MRRRARVAAVSAAARSLAGGGGAAGAGRRTAWAARVPPRPSGRPGGPAPRPRRSRAASSCPSRPHHRSAACGSSRPARRRGDRRALRARRGDRSGAPHDGSTAPAFLDRSLPPVSAHQAAVIVIRTERLYAGAVVEATEGNRLDRRKARTRAALVGAARGLLTSRDPLGVSIQEITDAADVGFGSFYNHFSSKEELFDAAVDEAIEEHGAMLEELTRSVDDPAEVFAVSVRITARFPKTHPELA